MRSDPLILAFDTSAAHCAAALLSGHTCIAARMVAMERGQAERLFPLIEDLLAETGSDWTSLAALGVGTGPGNFTGVRIAVAGARGAALALGIPAIGVSLFEVMAKDNPPGAWLVSIEGRQGRAFVQVMEGGAAVGNAQEIYPAEPPSDLGAGVLGVIGFQATEIGRPHGLQCLSRAMPDLAETIARIAADKLRAGLGTGQTFRKPSPFYIRAADAALPSDPPPFILQE